MWGLHHEGTAQCPLDLTLIVPTATWDPPTSSLSRSSDSSHSTRNQIAAVICSNLLQLQSNFPQLQTVYKL